MRFTASEKFAKGSKTSEKKVMMLSTTTEEEMKEDVRNIMKRKKRIGFEASVF